jgi:hypothetical protein
LNLADSIFTFSVVPVLKPDVGQQTPSSNAHGSLCVVKLGDRVTAPDPLNALGGGRTAATFVSVVELPAPSVLQGPALAPLVLHRVRYDDGTEENWAEGSVLPMSASEDTSP